jgi:hypothetical protein
VDVDVLYLSGQRDTFLLHEGRDHVAETDHDVTLTIYHDAETSENIVIRRVAVASIRTVRRTVPAEEKIPEPA